MIETNKKDLKKSQPAKPEVTMTANTFVFTRRSPLPDGWGSRLARHAKGEELTRDGWEKLLVRIQKR